MPLKSISTTETSGESANINLTRYLKSDKKYIILLSKLTEQERVSFFEDYIFNQHKCMSCDVLNM